MATTKRTTENDGPEAEPVVMDLAQNIRDEDGTLHYAGPARTIPAALAARLAEPAGEILK